MKIEFYQIDAFTSRVFGGNPAGVCFLESWPEDLVLQAIAMENNLSETAFLVPSRDAYDLRWFTPTVEVDLCGHATLASAHALFEERGQGGGRVVFRTKSGQLAVERRGDLLEMDFPARTALPCEPPENIAQALGRKPKHTLRARDFVAVFDSEQEIRNLKPNAELLGGLDEFAVVATARGEQCDFVSRFFAPRAGIPEDPVTGSSHCTLAPYWSGLLEKKKLHALQLSARGGELFCEDHGDRVSIAGRAVTYLSGSLSI